MRDPMMLIGLVVLAGVLGTLGWYFLRSARASERHQQLLDDAVRLGTTEPVSLHPRIDEHKCICTGACVTVCPEKEVIGMIDGKPRLVKPTACIGHGECLRACPVGAIELVIGTEKRGVDLPLVDREFQTNVPGLYIAGELGGMGLIHNAVNQGTQAGRAIAASLRARPQPPDETVLDLVVVGAGPAGMATALQAQKEKLKYVLFDQEQLGGALASYPRQKLVMTAPVDLPGYGKVKLRRTTKEAILDLWKDIAAKTALNIEAPVKVESVKPGADGAFVVETSAGTRRARRVALCIGRRGTPRKLGVPGEGASKVTYRLTEPEQYRGTKCMVVGGGDSAVEAALMLSRQPGTQVILAHRGKAFDRCKPDNFVALEEARVRGAVDVRLGTAPTEIGEGYVMLRAAAGAGEAGAERVENEWVIVCIGGELPTAWLSKIGIEVQTLRGQVHPAMRA